MATNEPVLFKKYLYYYKRTNKDGSEIFVCSQSGCSSSISRLNNEVIKVNGEVIDFNEITDETLQLSHNNSHVSLTDGQILARDFKKKLKIRTSNENLPINQVYQEEQSKIINETGNMELVANLP